MERKESETVMKLREELSINEKRLDELNSRSKESKEKFPEDKVALRDLKKEIKETKKTISQKKELIMILGDGEFYSEHGDMFDKLLDRKAGSVEDEIIRVEYPLRGIGLAVFMEIREIYYKLKDR